MVIIVDDKDLVKCNDFAEKRIEASAKLYAKRGEQNLEKIHMDILGGTIAEFGVQAYLQYQGVDCTEPDLAIYEVKKKSYQPDLISGRKLIHVKSQSKESAERHGLSWSFQKKDSLTWGPGKQDYIAFTETNGNMVTIKAIVQASKLLNNYLYSDPKNANYAATKTVVYFEELVASGIELREI